jgi:hypothetical protein
VKELPPTRKGNCGIPVMALSKCPCCVAGCRAGDTPKAGLIAEQSRLQPKPRQRVFFGGPRFTPRCDGTPYGCAARIHLSNPGKCESRNCAVLPNPGVSAWLSLAHRAKLCAVKTLPSLGQRVFRQVDGKDREASGGRTSGCCRAEFPSLYLPLN